MMKQARSWEAVRDQGRLSILPSTGFSSPFRAHPLPTSILDVRHVVQSWPCRAASLPSHTFVKPCDHQGESPVSENHSETQLLLIRHPQQLSFLSGYPWEGEMDETVSLDLPRFSYWLMFHANGLLNWCHGYWSSKSLYVYCIPTLQRAAVSNHSMLEIWGRGNCC